MTLTGYVLVALGGALGATLRHLAGLAWDRPERLPLGTIGVNLLGSALLGVLNGASVVGTTAALAAVGLCGALTTYSTFVVQAHDRGVRLGALIVLLTAAPALALYAAGVRLGALLLG